MLLQGSQRNRLKKYFPVKLRGGISNKAKYSFPDHSVGYSIRYPLELVVQGEEQSGVVNQLYDIVSFIPKNTDDHLSIFKISLYLKSLEELLPEDEDLKAKEIVVGGIAAEEKVERDAEGYEVRKFYIPLPSGNYTFLLQGTVFPEGRVGIDCNSIVNEMIESFRIENL